MECPGYRLKKEVSLHTKLNTHLRLLKKIYDTYVRPILEFAINIWNPWFQKDTRKSSKTFRQNQKIKALQLRQPTWIPKFDSSSRSYRQDLIETYKILTNKYDLNFSEAEAWNFEKSAPRN